MSITKLKIDNTQLYCVTGNLISCGSELVEGIIFALISILLLLHYHYYDLLLPLIYSNQYNFLYF